jgi:hypothetical protein
MSADICTRERRDARLEISQVCVIQQLKSASRAEFDPRQHFCCVYIILRRCETRSALANSEAGP